MTETDLQYVVTYSHKFGHDTFTVNSLKDAHVLICKIILEWLSDLDDIETEMKIAELIKDRQWTHARNLYEKSCDESFNISASVRGYLLDSADDVVAMATRYHKELVNQME